MSKKKKKADNQRPDSQPKSSKMRFLWIALAVSLALNVALLYWYYDRNYSESDTYTMLSDCMVRLEDALAREEEYVANIQRMERMITDFEMAAKAPGAELEKATEEKIRAMGLEHPLSDLRNNLRQHAELIPIRAAAGSKMRFPSTEGITVLSPNLVFARFSDGTTDGHMVLEFTVDKNKRIDWKVLGAYRDQD